MKAQKTMPRDSGKNETDVLFMTVFQTNTFGRRTVSGSLLRLRPTNKKKTKPAGAECLETANRDFDIESSGKT